jgi:hypothetical protein
MQRFETDPVKYLQLNKKQFNLRALFFWTTIVCILLALFRRPICELFNHNYVNQLLFGYYHIFWLLGVVDVLDYSVLTPYSNTGRLITVFSAVSSIIFHAVCIIVFCETATKVYNKYVKGANND